MQDVITVNVAITSWIIFWLTYWIFGSLISWRTHVTNIRHVFKLKEVLSVLLVNMIWSLLGIIIMYMFPLRAMNDSHIVVKFMLTYFITEIWFFHVHMLIHHPQLYSKIHKIHHFKPMDKPYALTALYCSPYETIVLNVFSTSLGPIIFQIPPPYLYLWYFLISLNSLLSHSGIYIPYLVEETHDLHHLHYNYFYGISVYLDWLYGTYKDEYRGVDEYKRSDEKELKIDEQCVTLGNFPINSFDMELK